MKRIAFAALLLTLYVSSFSQDKPSLLKSWIKLETENLSSTEIEPDTLYTRYTFAKSNEIRFGFYPGWDDYKQTWKQSENNLTIGFDTYKVEELTDTSLVIALAGFRRYKFLAESHLANKQESLERIGEYKAVPLYQANRYVTARYKKEKLKDDLQANLEPLRGKAAEYFLATFVITVEGKVEDVQIVHGISEGFTNQFTKQLLKTSKQWQPAMVNGQAVQIRMAYEIKYLKSIIPYNSGRLN